MVGLKINWTLSLLTLRASIWGIKGYLQGALTKRECFLGWGYCTGTCTAKSLFLYTLTILQRG